MDGPEIERGFILTRDDVIEAVGPMERAPDPDGNEVADLEGAWALPGLIDAHTHIGMWEDGLGFEGDDGNEATDPATPQLRAVDGVNPLDRAFSEALESGITTVMTGPGSTNPIGGQMLLLKTFGVCADDMAIASPAAMKFALGENPKSAYSDKNTPPTTRMAIAAIIREQLSKALEYKNRFDDDEQDDPEYDIKAESLLPVLAGELAAHFHAHRADDIATAIRLSKEYGLRPVIVHCTEGAKMAEVIRRCGCGVILGPLMTDRSKPELREQSITTPAELDRAGIEFAICSDHPETPAKYLTLSAALAVKAGLDRQTALRAVTINAARVCGADGAIGSLTPGKQADIAVFDRDPLDMTAEVKYVMVSGKTAVNRL